MFPKAVNTILVWSGFGWLTYNNLCSILIFLSVVRYSL